MTQQQALPFFHSLALNEEQGAKDLPVTFNFASGVTSYANSASLEEVGLFTLQGVFIDNSASPAPTTLLVTGTRQVIVIPPFTQAFERLLGSPLMLDYVVTNNSQQGAPGVNVTVHFLNIMPDSNNNWSAQPPLGLQGTPNAASSAAAAGANNLSIGGVAGRRTFVSGFEVSGAGATGASIIPITLANIDNNGAPITLNYQLAIPAGAGVAIPSLIVEFSPPLPVVLGSAAILSVPSFGAGNTNAAATLHGFTV